MTKKKKSAEISLPPETYTCRTASQRIILP